MSADVIDIHKPSIGAELAWTTDTEELSDRVVLSKHYNGKMPIELWLSRQNVLRETKDHRDMGTSAKKGFK